MQVSYLTLSHMSKPFVLSKWPYFALTDKKEIVGLRIIERIYAVRSAKFREEI